jgi:16S rRNA (guanine966-N2)-methyltransferase
MRIVGGRFRGRALVAPPGAGTRPTTDRARQAVFNILEHAAWSPFAAGQGFEGVRVLDLYAARERWGWRRCPAAPAWCLFVETDEAARGAIRTNVDALGLFGATRIHRRDAADLGPRPGGIKEAHGLVFLDPPYGRGLVERTLPGLAEHGWLTDDALDRRRARAPPSRPCRSMASRSWTRATTAPRASTSSGAHQARADTRLSSCDRRHSRPSRVMR